MRHRLLPWTAGFLAAGSLLAGESIIPKPKPTDADARIRALEKRVEHLEKMLHAAYGESLDYVLWISEQKDLLDAADRVGKKYAFPDPVRLLTSPDLENRADLLSRIIQRLRGFPESVDPDPDLVRLFSAAARDDALLCSRFAPNFFEGCLQWRTIDLPDGRKGTERFGQPWARPLILEMLNRPSVQDSALSVAHYFPGPETLERLRRMAAVSESDPVRNLSVRTTLALLGDADTRKDLPALARTAQVSPDVLRDLGFRLANSQCIQGIDLLIQAAHADDEHVALKSINLIRIFLALRTPIDANNRTTRKQQLGELQTWLDQNRAQLVWDGALRRFQLPAPAEMPPTPKTHPSSTMPPALPSDIH